MSERKAIFIRNPKCATISIRAFLSSYTSGVKIDEQEAHQRAHQYKESRRDYGQHHVFTVCRNPYDRLLSGWLFICRRKLPKHKEILKKYGTNFQDFVLNLEQDFNMKLTEVDMVTWPQHMWILDKESKVIVHEIGRFEELGAWWPRLCKRMGWPNKPLSKRNTTKHGPWQEYYTPAMYEIVNDQYKEDFKLLNYEMVTSS